MSEPTRERLGLAVALLAMLWVVVKCAWLCDDAFITLRTVEHFVSGHGLRFNVAERVQAFTHPLWMLLLVPGHAATRDPVLPPLVLSVGVSMAAITLAATRATPTLWAGASLALVLGSSKGFVDFSTSGLENPLTHLLLAGLWVSVVRRAPLWVPSLLAGLMLTNRLDTVLLVAPVMAWLAYTRLHPSSPTDSPTPTQQVALHLAAGLLPVVVWHSCALVYYGVPLPNTAYAKLGNGLSRAELLASGATWLGWAARVDPASLVALVLGAGAALAGNAHVRVAMLGAALYVAYVVWIGGDFMGDRFLSAPVLVAALAIAAHRWRWAAGAVVLLVSLGSPASPWRSGAAYTKADPSHGVVDERGYYWRGLGLPSLTVGQPPPHPFARKGARLQRQGSTRGIKATAGLVGYYAGPGYHLVDPLGLTDPLLARLPAAYDPHWRVGHFRRHVPNGYLQTAGTDDIQLEDAEVAHLYEVLGVVTRGPLFTAERWAAIVALNTGQLGHLIDTEHHRYPKTRPIPATLPARVGSDGLQAQVSGPVEVELSPTEWTVHYTDEGQLLRAERRTGGPQRLVPPDGATRVRLFAYPPGRLLRWAP